MTERNWELQKNIDGRVWFTVGWNLTEDQAKSMARGVDGKRAVKAEEPSNYQREE